MSELEMHFGGSKGPFPPLPMVASKGMYLAGRICT